MKQTMGVVEIYDDFFYGNEASDIINAIESIANNEDIPEFNWEIAGHGNDPHNGRMTKYRTNDLFSISNVHNKVQPNTVLYAKYTNTDKFDLINKVASLHEMLSKRLSKYAMEYAEKYRFPVEFDEGFSILKYSEGQEYKPHADYGTNLPRYFSALWLLNPAEYEGGGTYFNYFDEEVKPESPSLVLFPANYAYTHQALPVTNGVKYAIVTWLGHKLDFEGMPNYYYR